MRDTAAIRRNALVSVILSACFVSVPFAAGQMSHTCKFTRGPLQGQTHTLPNRSATAVGAGCSDGLTSSGVTVRDPDNSESPEPTSHTCRFTRGPLQGQTHTMPNREATAIGSTCSDGLTSSGIAVRDPENSEKSERSSHTCRFNRGPLQGQTHTMPNREAIAVGSTCSDGLTSSGIAVPDPDTPESSVSSSHTCRFARGPLQGQTQTLPNRNATRLGSTCSDGLTSSGIAVPDPS